MKIKESLDRVLASQDIFGDGFYKVFLNRCPEVKKYFEGVNMQRQAVMLTMALIIVERYYSNPYPATKKYLQHLGTKHADRSIPQELYAKWTEAMLETLAAFHGKDWDDQVGQQWREAIGQTINVMFEGYEQRFTV